MNKRKKQICDSLASVIHEWDDDQIDDFITLMELYKKDRSDEHVETAVEMLVPESLGNIVLLSEGQQRKIK